MSTYTILIILSSLVIFSYLFDIIARRTKFPSVLLLLLTGIGLQIIVTTLRLPDINLFTILPTLGTIGLILIVFEGALELKYERKRHSLIRRSFLSALIILLASSAVIGWIIHLITDFPFQTCLLNAVPFSVISSAIAIPSVSGLETGKKEFVVYESTFSDILGIILFNFLLFNEKINAVSFVWLGLDTLIVLVVSSVFCLLLLYIIGRINHQVKFFLILAILVLVYSIGRAWHLSTLIIVLALGLFMNNAEQIRLPLFRKYFLYPKYKDDLLQLYRLSAESAFLVRTFFFVIFGFIISLDELNNWEVAGYGAIILAVIYLVRAVYLKWVNRSGLKPELFINPRGLISILLFLTIPDTLRIPGIDTGLLFLIILVTSIIMSIGLMTTRRKILNE
ncbi:MAG: cation:proton antiporter [Bacteroidales bacterium]|nr:cation:proton antiporter [Lentimicrobiaceae bacterium]MDD5695603.1 cation:proton antiporter [Bacteroidales bacterium]